ncbi:MFS transporter [Paenibacillus sp. GSMTC-2017]|uniref:MDR family MFS transporter n=1 Tax=Paenibacillus sp. GSMTC-2017 TaxID=2794350 RepID=UPI0018D922C7|nr:MDR family MFS transporter [Paenibacillus sp. GSMTC-2017]MBH5319701.1 MFS transporter [Paenibacillus sp. GSMTC-2017]
MTLSKGKSGWVVAGLLLSILMASMDNTIVATAMGTIVGELGGLNQFVWVTSAYMVAEMAGMPIFGKLSDMYGRKRFFVFGIIVFMIGSALCGTASSIIELSIFRAIQGIGAGALVPITFTILLDAVSPENRGKLMGLFGAVFGLSSIFGPLLGAFITDTISWEWIFYINMPIGIVALFLVAKGYKESPTHAKQKIDWLGASTLVGAVISLLFALELGGKVYAWDSWQIIGMLTGFVGLGILFVIAEKRAIEPIISFAMFKIRLFAASTMIAVLSGAAFIAASVYLPIFIQGVLGGTATNSGLMLLPMMVGTVVTATLGGVVMTKLSYRTIMFSTLFLLVAGLGLLTTITADTSRLVITIYMVIVGLGIGASFSVLTNSAIHSIPTANRGAATATLNFLRSFGMMLGITIFGILQSHLMTRKLTETFQGGETVALPQGIDLKDPYVLMDASIRESIPEGILGRLLSGVSLSITEVFLWSLIPAVLALLVACIMGREKYDTKAEMEAYGSAH